MNLDELKDGIFNVWHPNSVDLLKANVNHDPDKTLCSIGGFCSTSALDRQGEEVLQRGLDFSEFIQFGWYNDNHQQHTAAAIGVPEEAEFKKGKGWWTQGYLLRGLRRAAEIMDLAKSLEGTGRKLGFSIEGKILERLGNRIVRALIRNVAITNSPVNTDCTWGLVAKSWATDIESKALSVGHARCPSEGGRVLVPEDLEKDEIKYVYYCPQCKKAFGSTNGLDSHMQKAHMSAPISSDEYPSIIRRTAKSLTEAQAMEYLHRLRPEYGQEVHRRLIDYVLAQKA